MALFRSHRWPSRQSHILRTVYLLGLISVIGIVIIWYGVNSDREYIYPLLTQLIPAGHRAGLTSTTFQCASCLNCAYKGPPPQIGLPAASTWKFEAGRDGDNQALSRAQCTVSFPGLFEDILRAGTFWRAHGGLDVEHLNNIPLKHGMARAAPKQDLEFVFSVEDKVTDVTTGDQPIWAFAMSAGEEAVWLMPDFGYWAWENVQNSIGPYDQMLRVASRGVMSKAWTGTNERIATNSIQTFRDRYLTKAAEACYWCMLFEGYSGVWNSSVPDNSSHQQQKRGFRYESFILEFDATSATSTLS
ncbi:hypothetical protein BP00DRAFT_442331 [Aspergillus indologenus CBS 114.80]|uniref:Glycosyl transferase CAP10 domain-containing protein n=1 Tax=Aspergillus indologenus CBS 114.80 TaxID=1450541 RepID=A0A2V5IPC2_9EURO|nr:hypothetical protein BP00DRAFT_442331 [Aspergillus indologenus CBS 114.80]